MKDILIRDANTSRSKKDVAHRLIMPRLWVPGGNYPGHMDWRDKAVAELESDAKLAKIIYWGTETVGSVVYQQHKEFPAAIDIKNISIATITQGRGFARLLMEQVVNEVPREFPDATILLGNAKASNVPIIKFAVECGFNVSAPVDLESDFGHNGKPDVLFSMPIRPAPSLITPN